MATCLTSVTDEILSMPSATYTDCPHDWLTYP